MKKLLIITLVFMLLGQTNSFAQCDPDITPPTPICLNGLEVNINPSGGPVTVWATDLNLNSSDNCTPSNELEYFMEFEPASATPPATTSIDFTLNDAGTHSIVMWAVDASGNADYCLTFLTVNICQQSPIMVCDDQPLVTLDINGLYDLMPQDILEGNLYCDYSGMTVELDGAPPALPVLTLDVDDIGTHLVRVQNAQGNACWGTLTVEAGVFNETCPQLAVDIATNNIRPCFQGNYKVYYANVSVFDIPDTYVDVALDEDLDYVSSTISAINLGNNSYRFETGDLAAGASGIFTIKFFADCDAVVGTTHCSDAQIFPDTTCSAAQPWSGAEVQVTGSCENDSIHLSIQNTGTAPNAQVLNYVVVEDVLMLTSNTFSLGQGASLNLDPIPASGATYRLEAEQEPGYPYGGMPSISIEGCGGLNPGLVTLFPTQNSNPAISVHCRESTASYDPNDKQGLPKGFGTEHLILKNTAIDYMIRFQNKGTDTAFTVVLVDTLSSAMNPQSIRMGAASHPYSFKLEEGNVLRIRFDDIQLPHETVDTLGSNGFVQFNIQQQVDNPDGTVIENRAGIYFDFNAPVITNTTLHTVGSHFIATVATNELSKTLPALKVYPNPASEVLYFSAATEKSASYTFTLSDVLGRRVQQRAAVTLPMTLQRGSLESGTYFFQFTDADGRPMWSGKVLVK